MDSSANDFVEKEKKYVMNALNVSTYIYIYTYECKN